MSTLLWSQKFLDKPSWCHRYMNTTLEQITGDIKGYGVKATSIWRSKWFCSKPCFAQDLCTYQCKAGRGRRGKRWESDIFQKINLLSNSLNKTKCEDKTVKFTQVSLTFILIYDLHDFHPSQWSNVPMSGEERFKYPHPQENKISQMPHWYSRANPHPMPCPASPRGFYIDRCVTW